LFFPSQLVLAGLQWKEALAFTMPRWYAWGLFAPLVLRTDRQLGSGLTLSRRVAVHIPLGTGFTLLCITIRFITRPLRGSAPPQSIYQFFLERFYWDLLIYAVIAGVAISRDYARQARDRERQAHELAVRAADLERRLAESRLQVLRAQLHPHFLFNALNTISAFTETDPRAARRLMEQLGDLLRASLTHVRFDVSGEDQFGSVLQFVVNYIQVTQPSIGNGDRSSIGGSTPSILHAVSSGTKKNVSCSSDT
jgi:hypothetical protein